MGCETWTFKNKAAFKKRIHDTAPHEFMFRVFDYQEDVLTSYEQAEKFVLDTLKNSTNKEPLVESDEENVVLTYTAQMKGKILLASENDEDELENPTLTLERLKSFFEKYPNGWIEFG
jgi:hypothetical protein